MSDQKPNVEELFVEEIEDITVEEAHGIQGGTLLPTQTSTTKSASAVVGPAAVSAGCHETVGAITGEKSVSV